MKESNKKNNLSTKVFKKFAVGCAMVAMFMCMLPLNANAASKSGTAKVWAGVPLIGSASIYTPYTVYYTGSGYTAKPTSFKTGKSYKGIGITVFSYSHYATWGEKAKTSYMYYINASGICDAFLDGCPVSLGMVTFQYTGSLK